MPTLYTYVLAYDDGTAPNPFGGVCSLVICKPAIRRTAQEGDWVVGTGSANSPLGDLRGRVLYAMRVTGKMSMQAYDGYAQTYLPNKVPDWRSNDLTRIVGDAIYDFSYPVPRLRQGVHNESNRATDLSGQYALLSEDFYYFGDQAIQLPDHLLDIVIAGQGHKSTSNAPYVEAFVTWIRGLGLTPKGLYGRPSGGLFQNREHTERRDAPRCPSRVPPRATVKGSC